MRNVKVWTVGVVAVVLTAGGFTATAFRGKGHPQPLAAQEPVEPVEPAKETAQVKVIHPQKGVLERLCVQPGSVHSFESVHLFAQVPGFLKEQYVDIGDHVKKGQLLARVDVPDIEAQVDRHKAGVDKARSQLEQMKARVNVAKANFRAAEAQVTQAEAMARSAAAWVVYRKIQLGRMEELVKTRSLQDQLYDEAKERHDASVESEIAAKVAIITANANVLACQAKIDQANADVIEAEAEIKVTSAELKRSEVNLAFSRIVAPFDGVITFRAMNPGDFVRAANGGANVEPLLTIHRTDKFRVVVLVPDRDVEFIKVGELATMKIDSLPGRTFTAKVSRLATTLEQQTRLMRVELDLPNPTGKIYHGMYGQVTIVLERWENLLSIPTSCIASKGSDGKGTVYVVHSGLAKKVQVELGMDTGLRVAVLKGLSPEDQVILNPTNELSEQPEVTPILEDDPATMTANGQ